MRIVTLILVLALAACAPQHNTKIPPYTPEMAAQDINGTLALFIQSYEKKDLDTLRGMLVKEPDLVIFGTGPNERYVGADAVVNALQKFFNGASNIRVKRRERVIKVSDDGLHALVSEYWDVTLVQGKKKHSYIDIRQTLALERRGLKWLIVQGHSSLGAK